MKEITIVKKRKEFTMMFKESVDGGYIGMVKEVPGAASQGETLDELENNLNDAMECVWAFNRGPDKV